MAAVNIAYGPAIPSYVTASLFGLATPDVSASYGSPGTMLRMNASYFTGAMSPDVTASYSAPSLAYRNIFGGSFFSISASLGGGGGAVVTYRFRGYYVAGATFEVWTGTSRNTPPPSGHTLIDIEVEATT